MPARTIETRECRECGETFPLRRGGTLFCCDAHRSAYNNRRIQRGGEVYDVLMEMRFDRKAASATKAWSTLCAIAGRFHDEDVSQRAGRPSWSPTTRMAKVQSRLGR